jgi:cytochrome c biogenesis protein CcdA
MITSFTFLGVFFATVGSALGFDSELMRPIAAALLILVGVILAIPALQNYVQGLLGPLSDFASRRMSQGRFSGLAGQFALGGLLGAVWSPCVGTTLGVALGLATQSHGLAPASLMMLLFGVGSAIPLLFIAYGSRRVFLANRSKLMTIASGAKPVLGIILAVMGAAVLSGADKTVEANLLKIMPEAWVNLITRY